MFWLKPNIFCFPLPRRQGRSNYLRPSVLICGKKKFLLFPAAPASLRLIHSATDERRETQMYAFDIHLY